MSPIFNRKVVQLLKKKHPKLTMFKTGRWERCLFYMSEDKLIFSYDKIDKEIFIHPIHVWELLQTYLELDYYSSLRVCRDWVSTYDSFEYYLDPNFPCEINDNDRYGYCLSYHDITNWNLTPLESEEYYNQIKGSSPFS